MIELRFLLPEWVLWGMGAWVVFMIGAMAVSVIFHGLVDRSDKVFKRKRGGI
jgi:hypothetical protein